MTTRKKWLKRRNKKDKGHVEQINKEIMRYSMFWNARSDARLQGLSVRNRRRKLMERVILQQLSKV